MTLPRQHLVDQVILRANLYNFVAVRGTPAAGRTTLCRLIANSLFQSQPLPVYLLQGWPQDEVNATGGWETYLELHTGVSGLDWPSREAYLLIDEAQQSYWDSGLWIGLFKTIAGGGPGPRVITFSSFGSPTGGYQGIDRTRGRFFQTPMVVGPTQKISMRALPVQGAIGRGVEPAGLLFDRDEAQTVISSFVSYYNGPNGAKIPEDLQDRLYHMTAGHPGVLTSLVHHMFVSCPVCICYSTISTPLTNTTIASPRGGAPWRCRQPRGCGQELLCPAKRVVRYSEICFLRKGPTVPRGAPDGRLFIYLEAYG